jgi:hypothetical protein
MGHEKDIPCYSAIYPFEQIQLLAFEEKENLSPV